MPRCWFQVCLGNFLIAGVYGLLLRVAFVEEIPGFEFGPFLQGHSHVAMLGWLYLALYGFIIHYFVPVDSARKRAYVRLFWLTQITVLGMTVLFPLQGYGPLTITCTSVHIVLSYIFIWRVLRDVRHTESRKSLSFQLLLTAFLFLILSTLATWALLPVSLMDMRGSALYYALIQFYLHFQFNGWFIFAAIALFFRFLETKNIHLNKGRTFFWLLTGATVLTYVLAVTWSSPHPALFYINSLGVVLQALALVYFLRLITPYRHQIKSVLPSRTFHLIRIAFWCFTVKIVVQTAVVIPYIATIAYTVRNYVIGFLHIILLGLMTHFLFALRDVSIPLPENIRRYNTGLVLVFLGFFLTEMLLFAQGTAFWMAKGLIPYYYEVIAAASVFIPVGIVLLLASRQRDHMTASS